MRLSLHCDYTVTMLVREEISDFTCFCERTARIFPEGSRLPGRNTEAGYFNSFTCIQKGSNRISIESYIRTNDEDPCKDDVLRFKAG